MKAIKAAVMKDVTQDWRLLQEFSDEMRGDRERRHTGLKVVARGF